jgi:pyruvate,water dikinase
MGKGKKIIEGRPGAKGVVVGVVRVVNKDKAKMEQITPGDVMVAERTSPEDEMYMAKASALVTDVGGTLSHTAIIAREMGKPAVVGTIEGTTVLKDGQKVVVDGNEGAIYEYVEEAGSLTDKVEELAKKKGINLPPGFLEKMKRRE